MLRTRLTYKCPGQLQRKPARPDARWRRHRGAVLQCEGGAVGAAARNHAWSARAAGKSDARAGHLKLYGSYSAQYLEAHMYQLHTYDFAHKLLQSFTI